jgi:2-aminoethylphosphonate-pyruvate transaminase
MTIDSAIILAAGVGKRLGDIGKQLPKSLLVIGERRLIDYSISALLASGVKNIHVVTGHLNEQLERHLSSHDQIKINFNKNYLSTGSMGSLLTLRDQVTSDFLLLDADIIYDPIAISDLVNCPHQNAVLLTSASHSGDEVWACASNGRLTALSKTVESQEMIMGEFVGITRLNLETFNKMCDLKIHSSIPASLLEYEQVISSICEETEIQCVLHRDLIWTEIDTQDQLAYAKQEVFPKLKRISVGFCS